MVQYVGDESRPDEVDVALVGKGITFDTGGLNIKTVMMEEMYGDKGGACAVYGCLQGCIKTKLKKNVVFTFAIAENAVGPDSYKPGDIITAMNGLTVEIDNTDAEGRLVLGDSMTQVQKIFKPTRVIYIATLTGAVVRALGTSCFGFFASDDNMVSRIQKASADAFEDAWHLPILDYHRDQMKGKYGADLNNLNSGGLFGG